MENTSTSVSEQKGPMVFFSISGSLRTGSSNTAILHTLKSVMPSGHEFLIYSHLDKLPHFNPDLDTESVPEAVKEFRGMINRSQGIIISTPEYAHGIPGSLKNALDWLVSTTVLDDKPIAIIMASAGEATFARDSLVEILKTMNGRIVPELIKMIPGIRMKQDHPEIWQQMKDLFEDLVLNSGPKS